MRATKATFYDMSHQSFYYPLFQHMADNHGLNLLDSEMEDIIQISKRLVGTRREYLDRIKKGEQPDLRQEEMNADFKHSRE